MGWIKAGRKLTIFSCLVVALLLLFSVSFCYGPSPLNPYGFHLFLLGIVIVVLVGLGALILLKMRIGVCAAWAFYIPVFLSLITPMVAPFAGAGILYAIWMPFRIFPQSSWIVRGYLPLIETGPRQFIQVIMFLLIFIGLALTIVGFVQILKPEFRRRKQLITTGLYSVVRHPQYLGIALWALGFTFYARRVIDFIAWITLVFLYLFMAEREERKLHRKFGKEYLKYKKRVPFIMPFVPTKFEQRLSRMLPSHGWKRKAIWIGAYFLAVTCLLLVLRPHVMLLE